MSFLAKCGGCNKTKFFVKKRRYITKKPGETATSHSELCNKCYINIKKMIDGTGNTKTS